MKKTSAICCRVINFASLCIGCKTLSVKLMASLAIIFNIKFT